MKNKLKYISFASALLFSTALAANPDILENSDLKAGMGVPALATNEDAAGNLFAGALDKAEDHVSDVIKSAIFAKAPAIESFSKTALGQQALSVLDGAVEGVSDKAFHSVGGWLSRGFHSVLTKAHKVVNAYDHFIDGKLDNLENRLKERHPVIAGAVRKYHIFHDAIFDRIDDAAGAIVKTAVERANAFINSKDYDQVVEILMSSDAGKQKEILDTLVAQKNMPVIAFIAAHTQSGDLAQQCITMLKASGDRMVKSVAQTATDPATVKMAFDAVKETTGGTELMHLGMQFANLLPHVREELDKRSNHMALDMLNTLVANHAPAGVKTVIEKVETVVTKVETVVETAADSALGKVIIDVVKEEMTETKVAEVKTPEAPMSGSDGSTGMSGSETGDTPAADITTPTAAVSGSDGSTGVSDTELNNSTASDASSPVTESVGVSGSDDSTGASAPVENAAEPVVDASATVTETTAPVVNAAEPVVDASATVTETAAPVVNAAEPVVDASATVTETAAPVVNAAEPVVDAVNSEESVADAVPPAEVTENSAEGIDSAPEAVVPPAEKVEETHLSDEL